MRDCSGKSREGHNKYACSHSCLQFVTKNRCQDQKHHHTTAGTDKTTDKAYQNTTDDRLHGTFFCRYLCHGFLRSHDRTNDKFNTKKEGHKNREVSHCCGWYQAWYIASKYLKQQHGNHHDQTIFHIQILIFSIGICRHGTRQYIRRQGDSHCHVWIHSQKGNQHRTDNRCRTHTGESGTKTSTHTSKKCNNNC